MDAAIDNDEYFDSSQSSCSSVEEAEEEAREEAEEGVAADEHTTTTTTTTPAAGAAGAAGGAALQVPGGMPTTAPCVSRQEGGDMSSVLERLRVVPMMVEEATAAGGGEAMTGARHEKGGTRFMVLDIIVQRSAQTNRRTEALLIGRAADGGSVCVCAGGWQPYLLVEAPLHWTDSPDRNSMLKQLLTEKLETYFDRRLTPVVAAVAVAVAVAAAGAASQHQQPFDEGSRRKRGGKGGAPHFIHRVSTVCAKSIYGFSSEGPRNFIKIEVAAPHLVNALRDVLSGYPLKALEGSGSLSGGGGRMRGVKIDMDPSNMTPMLLEGQSETFNSNIDAVQQFMVDTGLVGCQWVRVREEGEQHSDAGGWQTRREEEEKEEVVVERIPMQEDRRSHCTYEWHVHLSELELLDVDDAPELAPLRLLSFDLEAAGRRGVFPQASEDPVIQIGVHFQVVGAATAEEARPRPVMLSLLACDPIEGADVVSFDREDELLRAFRDLVVTFDADVLMGYNILNFDFPYLHDRAAALCGEPPRPDPPVRLSLEESDNTAFGAPLVRHFDNMSRLRGAQLQLRETEYVSAQTGKRKRTKVTIAGRVSLDMLVAIQNSQHRLEQYKLDAVAEYFLGDHKVDIPFTQITPMWNEGPAARRELAVYCLKDAQLPLDLNAKIDSLTQTVEMARSTGTLFDEVLQRGVMVRNRSLMLRRAKQRALLFPNLSPLNRQAGFGDAKAAAKDAVGRKQRYTGATVLEPRCGVHPYVGVLDFSAMYPSIIRAHNLCYSTIVLKPENTPPDGGGGEPRGLLRVNGHVFVSEAHFKGLIPEVVEHLQNCRNKAKRAYAAATDPMAKQVCKARELAFKVAGNGVYGALGSTLSLLPLLAIAESVTALGRQDIMMVKRMAEEMYPDGEVVYGDTDSVFVRLPLAPEVAAITMDAVQQASEMSVALAERVNARLKAPKKIEFEKVFAVMLLLSKKRYAGIKYEPGFKFGIDTPPLDVKGLQSVRRDGSPLVRDLVRDVIQSILDSGSEVEAAALVRRRLLDIVEDRVEYESFAVKKTLRKSMADCCFPLRPAELKEVRRRLGASNAQQQQQQQQQQQEQQLSYAEQDQAIYAKITLPWRPRIRLPHVLLAWRLRLHDPGSSPVPGENISYIVTNNGGGKIFEKVETLEAVRTKHLPVDRKYYLQSLRVPVTNIFQPIMVQRILLADPKLQPDEVRARAEEQVKILIWNIIKGKRFEQAGAKRKACIDASPIARAFARQRLGGDGGGVTGK